MSGAPPVGGHLLSIVVPVYNEEATVAAVVERLLAIELPIAREIVVVNDGSTDGTRAALEAIAAPTGALRIVHAPVNGGKGRAVRTGFAHARGTIFAIQDADLELEPADLARLVQPILDGEAAVVYGSRFLAGRPAAPWTTVAANRFLTFVTNLLYRARLTDMETCYKVLRADVARALPLRADRFDIEPEITARLLRGGQRIVERAVRYAPRSRAEGKKIGWRDGLRALVVLAVLRVRA